MLMADRQERGLRVLTGPPSRRAPQAYAYSPRIDRRSTRLVSRSTAANHGSSAIPAERCGDCSSYAVQGDASAALTSCSERTIPKNRQAGDTVGVRHQFREYRVRRAGTVIEEPRARTLNRPLIGAPPSPPRCKVLPCGEPARDQHADGSSQQNAWGRTRTGTGLPPRDFRTTTAFTAACLGMHLWSGLYLCRPARPRARIRQEPSSLYTFLGSSQRSIIETKLR
jgi:hypothetical protein